MSTFKSNRYVCSCDAFGSTVTSVATVVAIGTLVAAGAHRCPEQIRKFTNTHERPKRSASKNRHVNSDVGRS